MEFDYPFIVRSSSRGERIGSSGAPEMRGDLVCPHLHLDLPILYNTGSISSTSRSALSSLVLTEKVWVKRD
jgi:hypothetical protein